MDYRLVEDHEEWFSIFSPFLFIYFDIFTIISYLLILISLLIFWLLFLKYYFFHY